MKTNKNLFIEKSILKHNNKYDYSLVDYINSQKKVKIICKEHGIFDQTPANHTRGQGCPTCKGVKKLNKNDFIRKSKEIHDDKYDYSLVDYKNNKTKVKIICKEHGIFEQTPNNHLNNHGCPFCKGGVQLNNDIFIKKSKEIHGDNKYDYSLVNYISSHIKIKIICKEHGVFEQYPYCHLLGYGCNKCSNKYKYDNIEFIKKSIEVHGDKYDYSLVNYINSQKKVKIICHKHGVFEQNATSHIQGSGCFKCYIESRKIGKDEFIKRSIEKHGDKYDYSLVKYENIYTKVKIICKEHGIFKQKPHSHLQGYGCSKCNDSRGEKEISSYLINNNIKYEQQYKFNECKFINALPFDFYLIDYNICIEYDGLQHFKPIEYFGGEKTFNKIKINDKIKNKYCMDNNIKLIRIKYNENIQKKLNFLINI